MREPPNVLIIARAARVGEWLGHHVTSCWPAAPLRHLSEIETSAIDASLLGDADVVLLNDDADADCTVVVDMDVFEAIATGEENAQMAFMAGKLKVEGDMGIAMQLGSILG